MAFYGYQSYLVSLMTCMIIIIVLFKAMVFLVVSYVFLHFPLFSRAFPDGFPRSGPPRSGPSGAVHQILRHRDGPVPWLLENQQGFGPTLSFAAGRHRGQVGDAVLGTAPRST